MRGPRPGDRGGGQDPGSELRLDRDPADRRAAGALTADLVEGLFRRESGRAVATLIRVTGDFDLAEESVQEAFVAALERWPSDGVPDNPGAWITTTARNRAIDRLRRGRTGERKREQLAGLERLGRDDDVREIPDDRLRLIFTCCHP